MAKTHALEIRPVPGYQRRVHAGAFSRAVETIMNFDSVDVSEATRRLMADLESGKIALKVEGSHAAYCFTS